MGQHGSHWTDFHEIWYFSIFRKSAEKSQVLLKPKKDEVFFTCSSIYIFDHISFRSSYKREMFQAKDVEKIKTHLCSVNPPPKIVPFVRECGKILQSAAGHGGQYGACAFHAG